LTIGAIADNEVLVRSGSAVIGQAGAPPTAHLLGSASHTADTLANLNTKVSDATLIDTGDARLSDARTPTAHDLGGSEHSADTLANLNAKVSDATLIDTGDARLSDSRAPTGAASGDLGGTYPGPSVAAITTTTGPTSLSIGAIADGELLVRSGSSITSQAGATPAAHNLGGSEHNADTLANLNTKVSDATLIDTGDARLSDARTPTTHDLGGSEHGSDTLANLNAKISDATLDDSSDTRDPTAHASDHESGGGDTITHDNLTDAGVNSHSQIDTHLGSTSNPHSVDKTDVSLSNVEDLKVNLAASDAPDANDDTGSGYAVGSRWIDTTADKEYVCLDATSTAAVWTETTQSGGGSPLTTKGDLFTYDTDDQRLAVGSDTNILVADSAATPGIKWVSGQRTYLPNSLPTGASGTIEALYQFDKNNNPLNDKSGNGRNLSQFVTSAGNEYYSAPFGLCGIHSRDDIYLQGPDVEALRIVDELVLEVICMPVEAWGTNSALISCGASGESLTTNNLYSIFSSSLSAEAYRYSAEYSTGTDITGESKVKTSFELELLTLTRDGSGNIKWYQNGVPLGSNTLTQPAKDAAGNTQRLKIMADEGGTWNYKGIICCVRITSGDQWTDSEVQFAYEQFMGIR
jgi:hypothetical protein